MLKKARKSTPIRNLVVISDLHCGCQLGLCPPEVQLYEGGTYKAHPLQQKMWYWWREFWEEFVPEATRGEPFAVAVNGDTLDGRHHNSTHQFTHNLDDQRRVAIEVLSPIREACKGNLYMIRGTEVHVGQSGENEEQIARELEAIPDETGRHSRYELWIQIGNALCHLAHHIGTTGSAAYETTALMREFAESCSEAGRWGRRAPDIIARAHRHRHSEIRVPTQDGYGICFTTASWQLRTPFSYRVPGGRIQTPQIGGSLIRQGDEEFFTRHRTWNLERSRLVTPLT